LLIGLIGKSNVGKSTFFNAATVHAVQTANYPFTTIEPNIGVGYVRTRCVCTEFGVQDNPVHSICVTGNRFIPVKILDVAGLVPDAHKGKGLGNQFLDSSREADALVHIVDIAGTTDLEGHTVKPGEGDPLKDVEFVLAEFDLWMVSLLKKNLDKISRDLQNRSEKLSKVLARQLSGLSMNEGHTMTALIDTGLIEKRLDSWSNFDLFEFCRNVRRLAKPMIIAANKADIRSAESNLERLTALEYQSVPCVSEAEVMLRLGAKRGLLRYLPGDSSFEVNPNAELHDEQKEALKKVQRVLMKYGSTGVQQILNKVCFELLEMVVVYPIEDENKLTDKNGNVLPDAYLVPKDSTAKDLADKVHEELGKGFLYAIDARSKQRLGAEYKLKDRDVIKIVFVASKR
jgi:ribosome-binding ATPase